MASTKKYTTINCSDKELNIRDTQIAEISA